MTKTCSHCNGTNISEIIYGLPAPESLLKPKKEKKNVVHGGCVIDSDSPKFYCNDCRLPFGFDEEIEE